MQGRLKNCALVICLFVFLFVIIGGGLHLNPSGAFLAAVTGTPLVIYVFHRRFDGDSRTEGAVQRCEKRGCVCQQQHR